MFKIAGGIIIAIGIILLLRVIISKIAASVHWKKEKKVENL